MPRLVKQLRGGFISQCLPGETANPNGRPRKYISSLKDQGYKLAEINDCIQVMIALTVGDLKSIMENEESTVLEKTIASAITSGIKKGSLYSIETLLSRVYGQLKETAEVTQVYIPGHGNPLIRFMITPHSGAW